MTESLDARKEFCAGYNPSMRKWYLSIMSIMGVGILAIGYFVFVTNSDRNIPNATISGLNEVEGAWYSSGQFNYHLVVDVEFGGERRRHEMSVENGQIVEATLSYWDDSQGGWGERNPLNKEQSFTYTITGLFDTIRNELQLHNREDVRVEMQGEPAIPKVILLGRVWQEGFPVEGTQTRIVVQEYTPITSNP